MRPFSATSWRKGEVTQGCISKHSTFISSAVSISQQNKRRVLLHLYLAAAHEKTARGTLNAFSAAESSDKAKT